MLSVYFSFWKQRKFVYFGLTAFIYLCECLTIFGQAPQLVKVTPPSPNAAALAKYGDIPISNYTGVPNISIPLYTAKFKDISVPISLSYHASGIKVAEDASQVGLGWALNAGGVISRNIIGIDDFLGSAYFNGSTNNLTDFADGQGPTNPVQTGCVLQMVNRTIPNSPTLYTKDLTSYLDITPPYDFQPDQYSFNFLDHSGKFILKRNKQAILEKQEKIDITLISNNVWQIKSDDGYIYDFTEYETCADIGSPGNTKSTAWYLTKITSPQGNFVTLSYTKIASRNVTTIGSYSETTDAAEVYTILPAGGAFLSHNTGTQTGMAPGKLYSHIVLNTIDFTNGVVKFFYSDNRLDLPGDQRLDSISVIGKSSAGVLNTMPMKTFNLSYSYFSYGDIDNDYMNSSTWGADANYKRLKLTQVSETGYFNSAPVAQPPYIFTYLENSSTTNLPSKASLARDHWGFYNGRSSNSSLIPSITPVQTLDYITNLMGVQGPERETYKDYVGAFTLSSIKYPTGGSTNFEYEANDFDEQQSMVNDHSFASKLATISQISKTLTYNNQGTKGFITTDTADLTDEYIYVDQNQGASLKVNLSVVFRFSSTAANVCSFGSSGLLTFDIYNSTGTDIIAKDYQNFNQCIGSQTDNCILCGSTFGLVSTYKTDLYLAPGKYKIVVHSDNSLTSIQDIRFTFTYYSKTSTDNTYGTTAFLYAGGLRIKKITDHDNVNASNDKVRKFIYHYFQDKNNDGTTEEYSYGRRMARPQYGYFDWSDELYVQHAGSLTSSTSLRAAHFMRSSDSNIPLNGSAGGSAVGYDHVTVLYGENGENGKSDYTYFNQPDFISDYIEGNGLPSKAPVGSALPNPLNGGLLEEKEYKNESGQFVKVKSINNTYNLESNKENRVYSMEVKVPILYNWDDGQFSGTGSLLPCSDYLYSYITLQSEWLHLDQTDEKIFNATDTTKYVQNITNYNYDLTAKHYYPVSTVVTNSEGESITSTTKYPLDYTIVSGSDPFSTGINKLQSSHVYNVPVEKYTTKADANGTNARVVNAVLTNFQASKPLPSVVYTALLSTPSTSFVPFATTVSSSSKDPSYQPLISFDSYDASGNIVQQHKDKDVIHSYVWDYNFSLPVADVTNADITSVAYTSFEGTGTGNWNNYAGTISTVTVSSYPPTGNKYYNLTSTNTLSKTSVTVGNTYVISYWSKNATPYTISGGSSTYKTGKTLNGWTYYEHTTTASSTTLTITGTGAIDEVRLYPTNAQMTTYTYEPLVGVTSQCDVNSNIMYYDYDAFARLRLIRGDDNNILKVYDYKYQQ